LSIPAWLAPGSTIKRWLLVFVLGLLIIVLGIAYLFVDLYRKVHFSGWVSAYLYHATLQDIPRGLRGALFLMIGVTAIWLSLRHLNKVIVSAMSHPIGSASNNGTTVIGAVAQQKMLLRGPRVVAVGGGTGMSLLLHGLRTYSRNLSVVVTVADDGGSSGRLRRELRILPPGDFRQCIAALADVEPLMADLLQHRFKRGSGLEGHTFGNLFIAAMADITGSFEKALAESSRVLAVRGRILPSTLQDVTLAAELRDQSTLEGESVVAKGKAPIERVFLIPNGAEEGTAAAIEANPEAVEAIREADMIVVGPGSLYTSIMPNLLVPDIVNAIVESHATLKVFVCNVATEPGETDGYTAVDFVQAVERHVGYQLFDYVITNSNHSARQPEVWKSQVVRPGSRSLLPTDLQMIECDVVDADNALRHDAPKLAQTLLDLYYDRRRRVPGHAAARRSGGFSRASLLDEEVLPPDDDGVVVGRA
jgi:uncharacterized cofD-like protein